MENKTLEEKELIAKYFENWLKNYTDKIILQIMENKKEEILNNPMTMDLLKRLYDKEINDNIEFNRNIFSMLYENNDNEFWLNHCKEFGVRNKYRNCNSYREVLYDLYIEEL